MLKNYINGRSLMVLLAFAIVLACLWFTNKMVRDIASEEKQRISTFATAIKSLSNFEIGNEENNLATSIIESNKSIPAILTDSAGIILDMINMPSTDQDKHLKQFKNLHQPIVVDITPKQYIYYGESKLLRQVRFFPLVLMGIVTLFLGIILIAYRTSNLSIQNRVWVGMSKETAHQLGTPLSSLMGWMEYLRGNGQEELANDMQKDVDRLQLVADRFSKIGSIPVLKEEDVQARILNVVEYMRKRASQKISIDFQTLPDQDVSILLNAALFDWVIENLIRNALDAMDGKGNILLTIENKPLSITIDVKDTGRGIHKKDISRVFKPGFTTKDRGWGLGLSLAKRIIVKYHYGELDVLKSEVGQGTTFRILLRR
jgi:Histidine kinase-, DNA gyrase B-, and HSP90-like ATPase